MAVTLTEAELAAALAVNDTLAARLHPVAVALVERYAPDAPPAVQDEAAIRCAGWLAESPAGAIRSETTGDVRTAFDPGRALSALRHSGAMGILSGWKARRAGAI